MNIKQYLQSKWDFKKTTEQNVITFNNGKEKAKKARRNLIIFSVIVIALSILFHNPMLAFALLIGALTFGSEYTFNSAAINYLLSVSSLDSTHFVVCYIGTSGYGKACIGTISNGNQISFGSEYNYYTNAFYKGSCVALDATHFSICYIDGSGLATGLCKIGVVSSGNVITFGSQYTFDTNTTVGYGLDIDKIDSTHFVIAYQNINDSTRGKCIVGTVSSGDQIAFGNKYTFNTAKTYQLSVAVLDSTHFVVSYKDGFSPSTGVGIIGTLDGSLAISYGSKYTYNSGTASGMQVKKLDSTHFVIAYVGSDNKGKAIIGTVASGNQISYGTEYEFNNSGTQNVSVTLVDSTHIEISYCSSDNKGYSIIGTIANVNQLTFDTAVKFNDATTDLVSTVTIDSTHIAIGYVDGGNSSYGTAIIGTVSFAAPAQAGFLLLML